MKKSLGKLKQVGLRECWKNEAKEFTPWLADEENLKLLGDAIQMELELEGIEQAIGDFKVDILAKDVYSDRYVVIENQLEKTDHDHLGKLLTYAAGRSAKTVIWIAEELKEEHRRALDWLNEKTDEEVEFFGLEIELWQVGDSKLAPKFNLVSQPNDWAKRIKFKNLSEPGKTKILQGEFWKGLNEHMKNKTFLGLRKPRMQHWQTFGVGRPGFRISLTLNSRLQRVGCELFIRKTELGFSSLKKNRENIEEELGSELEWKELPDKKGSRIIQYYSLDFQDKKNWPELFNWFQERAEAFHKTFNKQINALNLDEEVA